MGRRREQFYCSPSGGGCGKYFLSYFLELTEANYTIECPNCGHHHFRKIKKGIITDDRHDKKLGATEIIRGLKSTIRDTSYENEAWFIRRNLRMYK